MGALLPPHTGNGMEQDHRNGSGLDTAGSGTRAAADEHKGHGQKEAPRAEGSGVSGIEAGGAGRNGVEQRRQDLLSQRPPCPQIIPFKQEKQQRATENQQCGGEKHHLGLQSVVPPVPAVAQHIIPHQETNTAYDDQAHQGKAYQRVVHIGHKGGVLPAVGAHKIKARITESGNGMPYSIVNSPLQAKILHKAQGQQHRSQALHQQCTEKDPLNEGDDAAELVVTDALHHHLPLPQAQPPPQQQHKQRGNGHKAQAAHLDHGNDYDLAKHTPVGTGILYHQAGNAGSRGSRKQGVSKGSTSGNLGGKRQHQQKCPHQNDNEKTKGNNLQAGKFGFFPLASLQHRKPPPPFGYSVPGPCRGELCAS